MSALNGSTPITSVVIPAFNEETSIGLVLDNLPQETLKEIILKRVKDNLKKKWANNYKEVT